MPPALDNSLRPPPHPLIPFLGEADIDALTASDEGAAAYARALDSYLQARRDAEWNETMPLLSDPYRGGLEPPHWQDADFVMGLGAAREDRTSARLDTLPKNWETPPYVQGFAVELRAALGRLPAAVLGFLFNILILLGGNRSGKSEYCAKRVVQAAVRDAGTLIVCTSEDMEASRKNQQSLIWKYLPREFKRLNGKNDPQRIFKINYSKAGGFTTEQCILPNGSTIAFKSYNGEPGGIEGWMLGNQHTRTIGAWADESCTVGWLKMFLRRCEYYGAILLWSFTPVQGMTPAIKEAVGDALTLVSLPSELLYDRVNLEGLVKGHMPYLQKARTPGAAVLYFWTQFNPFGPPGGFYAAVKRFVQDKTWEMKARFAHGYTVDTSGRKFPGWGPVNVRRLADVPQVGTLRRFIDPHGSRPYAMMKVLTGVGKTPSHYIVQNWPDEKNYGEWAVPTQRETNADSRKGWDGDMGPAQRPLGWGVAEYKKLLRELDRIAVPEAVLAMLREAGEQAIWNEPAFEEALRAVRCPWWEPSIIEAVQKGWRGEEPLYETIHETFMDARFCNAEYAAEHGTTCLRFVWEETQTGADGVKHPPVYIREAAGKDLEHGYGLITELLAWDRFHPDGYLPHINAPRLYAVEECTQVRWALENYTGRSGQEGACKEWIDLTRHLAEEDPRHITAGAVKTRGGGSY